MKHPYSITSKHNRDTCVPELIKVANHVAEYWDTIIPEGYRGEEKQNEYYTKGTSRIKWPHGKHNSYPSKAIHLAPYNSNLGIDWKDTELFYKYGFFVMGLASSLGIKLRWGGDWDMDGITTDQTFNDLIHFEFVRKIEW